MHLTQKGPTAIGVQEINMLAKLLTSPGKCIMKKWLEMTMTNAKKQLQQMLNILCLGKWKKKPQNF